LLKRSKLENLIYQAQASIVSARTARKAAARTRREDFKDRDDKNWMKHTVIYVDGAGKTKMTTARCTSTRCRTTSIYDPPKAEYIKESCHPERSEGSSAGCLPRG